MYHVELRQFPHNFCHFNLSDGELAAIVEPWKRGEPIEVGDRKWSPHQAKIRILEGPELAVQELSMGRGWRAAERRSQEVTDRVLATAPPPPPAPPPPGPVPATAPAPAGPGLADPLAALVQIGALLGPEAPRLLDAWRVAAGGDPSLSPSQALAMAEQDLRSPGEGSQGNSPGG
jgi:hypothetical protein